MMQKPLTKKARAAIERYVLIRAQRRGNYLHMLVDDTLKADRMDRDKLYNWLEKKGWRWLAVSGTWVNVKHKGGK